MFETNMKSAIDQEAVNDSNKIFIFIAFRISVRQKINKS